ncbi:MAG: HU family DNA-binding protein [Acidobacteria bacterium]|nr:HU family DNA-binding protein [Acidobacteriota bacterium]MCB9398139.1 HU family DNA-binding protein [Acidobacteriota bacterium]
MNRKEVIQALVPLTELSPPEADWVVRHFFQVLTEALAAGRRVELRGLGSWVLSERKQADFVNPQDGKQYTGRTIRTVLFQASRLSKQWLAGSESVSSKD